METLGHYLSLPVVQKLLLSGTILTLMSLALFFSRRFIHSLKSGAEKKRVYGKSAVYTGIVVYGLVLVRIWAFKNLFLYFKHPVIEKLLKSGMAFVLIYLALFFVRRFINSMKIEIKRRHQYRKRATYIATLIYFIVLIPIWAGHTQQWTTVLSVMGAGVALALHEVLLNIAGWVYIVVRRPYKAGDRIELGGVKGDVIDIRLFQTTLLEIGNWVDGDQSTGRVVDLPHGQIFRNPLYNYTKGFEFLWNELSIMVTFESNWEKAKEILLKCGEEASREVQQEVERKIDRMAREYLIYYRRFTPVVYTKIEDSGIKITLRYLTDAKKRRMGEDCISRKILADIGAAPDIDFAYPTYRIYKRGEKE